MKEVLKKIRPLLMVVTPALFGLFIFSQSPALTESIYSAFLYPIITRIVTFLFGWLPFSLSEIIVVLILPALILLIFQIFRKKITILRTLYLLLFVLSSLFSWFYVSWGFNYLRQPMTERLQISSAAADSTLLKQALQEEIDQANASYLVYKNFSKKDIEEKVEKAYKLVEKQLKISFPGGIRHPKKMLIHAILNKTMTSGIFSPFFHEVHVNEELLPIEYPFILAHEKAHQMGIANEAEANFLAYLVCTATPDRDLNYSAHFSLLGKILRRAYRTVVD